jgi:carbamoylphosphate synthase small subunit
LPPFLTANAQPAFLALADGTVFQGLSIGAAGHTSGEVVFNTAMTGYQEILTDPSYSRQIVTLTYPHIGNTGVNPEDVESDRIHAAGLVIRDLPLIVSNFRATQSLPDYLKSQNIVAIAAGSGITPIMSIAKQLQSVGGNMRLFYGNRTEEDILFNAELNALSSVKSQFALSGETKEGFLSGRIDKGI